jgi:O-antigen/teichoic acid export membrane protein
MLNHFVGVGAVGVYNLAMRMLGLPISFIGGAISNVFQQRATDDYYKYGNYNTIFKKVLKTLILVSILPTILFMAFGENIIVFVFGQEWKMAGKIISILAPVFALKLINSPLSYGFFIHKLQNIDFILSIILFVCTFTLMKIMFDCGFKYITVITGYSIFFSLTYILLIFLNYSLSTKA